MFLEPVGSHYTPLELNVSDKSPAQLRTYKIQPNENNTGSAASSSRHRPVRASSSSYQYSTPQHSGQSSDTINTGATTENVKPSPIGSKTSSVTEQKNRNANQTKKFMKQLMKITNCKTVEELINTDITKWKKMQTHIRATLQPEITTLKDLLLRLNSTHFKSPRLPKGKRASYSTTEKERQDQYFTIHRWEDDSFEADLHCHGNEEKEIQNGVYTYTTHHKTAIEANPVMRDEETDMQPFTNHFVYMATNKIMDMLGENIYISQNHGDMTCKSDGVVHTNTKIAHYTNHKQHDRTTSVIELKLRDKIAKLIEHAVTYFNSYYDSIDEDSEIAGSHQASQLPAGKTTRKKKTNKKTKSQQYGPSTAEHKTFHIINQTYYYMSTQEVALGMFSSLDQTVFLKRVKNPPNSTKPESLFVSRTIGSKEFLSYFIRFVISSKYMDSINKSLDVNKNEVLSLPQLTKK